MHAWLHNSLVCKPYVVPETCKSHTLLWEEGTRSEGNFPGGDTEHCIIDSDQFRGRSQRSIQRMRISSTEGIQTRKPKHEGVSFAKGGASVEGLTYRARRGLYHQQYT